MLGFYCIQSHEIGQVGLLLLDSIVHSPAHPTYPKGIKWRTITKNGVPLFHSPVLRGLNTPLADTWHCP